MSTRTLYYRGNGKTLLSLNKIGKLGRKLRRIKLIPFAKRNPYKSAGSLIGAAALLGIAYWYLRK